MIPNSSWKSLRMMAASSKSSIEPAMWGCVAYSRDARSALAGSGIDLHAGAMQSEKTTILCMHDGRSRTGRAPRPSPW